jgi:hypothetical protein
VYAFECAGGNVRQGSQIQFVEREMSL